MLARPNIWDCMRALALSVFHWNFFVEGHCTALKQSAVPGPLSGTPGLLIEFL
jgi:hypothetical protein